MPPSSTVMSPTLGSLLRFTKFVSERNIWILEFFVAWITVVVFGFRYVIDYGRLRWKLYRIARRVAAESTVSSPQITAPNPMDQLKTIQSDVLDDKTRSALSPTFTLCDCISLSPLAHTRAEMSVGIDERSERLRRELFIASSAIFGSSHKNDGDDKKELNNNSSSNSNNSHENQDDDTCEENGNPEPSSLSRIAVMTHEWTDEDWIKIVHSSLAVRREASYLMVALQSEGCQRMHNNDGVLSKLRRLWPRLLELPRTVVCDTFDSHSAKTRNSANERRDLYGISLIIPMYKERISDIGDTMNRAFNNCRGDPKKIQVIVVHVESSPTKINSTVDNDRSYTENNDCRGGSLLRQQLLDEHDQQRKRQKQKEPQRKFDKNDANSKSPPSFWGELKVVTIPFGKGGGRGKTLNAGAKQASAPILTFLHADTTVPLGWDVQIQTALLRPAPSSSTGLVSVKGEKNQPYKHGSETSNKSNLVFPHACAFTMAIDNNSASNKSSFKQSHYPPGLLGAEWLGVLRCHCGLPYGDSVLSFSRPMFDYMGGYPEQPLMEDYEVMDWLRLRSILFSNIQRMTSNNNNDDDKTDGISNHSGENGAFVPQREDLVLLKDRAFCSPRRWEKYGVSYTSFINAICIYRYRSMAFSAEDLFDFYYHCNSSNLLKSNAGKNE